MFGIGHNFNTWFTKWSRNVILKIAIKHLRWSFGLVPFLKWNDIVEYIKGLTWRIWYIYKSTNVLLNFCLFTYFLVICLQNSRPNMWFTHFLDLLVNLVIVYAKVCVYHFMTLISPTVELLLEDYPKQRRSCRDIETGYVRVSVRASVCSHNFVRRRTRKLFKVSQPNLVHILSMVLYVPFGGYNQIWIISYVVWDQWKRDKDVVWECIILSKA